MNRSFDEIQVFENVATRTGVKVERAGVRGRRGVCRSLTELNAKCRRLGDGYYYLAASAWPEEQSQVTLGQTWQPLS